MTKDNRVKTKVQFFSLVEWVGIDLRSLALFRIVFCTIMLFDLWIRSGSIYEHYTSKLPSNRFNKKLTEYGLSQLCFNF